MAKFVIAGKADCPFYAAAELVADELKCRLTDFKTHKIVIQPDEWDIWVKKTCEERNWAYDGRSPLIWRELIDRGGKGILLGSCSDFLEMANGYYGIKTDAMTDKLQNIAQENKATKEENDLAEIEKKNRIKPLKICVTAAASDISYHIILGLCNNKVFLDKEDVVIYLLDDEDKQTMLQGICMELLDSAPAQLNGVIHTTNAEEAFKGASLIICLDGFNLTKNLTEPIVYQECLKTMDFSRIKSYGEIIGKTASEDAKVLVAGGPCNVISNILLAAAKNLDAKNCWALSRLHENKAKRLIANRLNVLTSNIKDLVIWGQPYYHQVIDVSFSRVVGYDGAIWGPHINGFSQDTGEMVHDEKWLSKQLSEMVLQKTTEIKKLKEDTMALSQASAIVDQLHNLHNDTNSDEAYSLGVASEGWYGIPPGIVFSFPVTYTGSGYEVVSTLELGEEIQSKLKELGAALKSQCDDILSRCKLPILK